MPALCKHCQILTHSVRRNVKGLIGQPISQVSINLPAGQKALSRAQIARILSDRVTGSLVGLLKVVSLVLSIDQAHRPLKDSQADFKKGYRLAPRCPPCFSFRLDCRTLMCLDSWGNIPAMDIVNLPNNEKDLKTDLSLAFAGRQLMCTSVLLT